MIMREFSRHHCAHACAPARRSAFTLIEVLVVVAIIALLVAILIPSLASARESARAAQCLSNEKQLGNATQMYTAEWKGSLPGPLHPMIMKSTYDDFYRSRDADAEGSAGGAYRRQQLVFYLRKYMMEKSKTAELFDRVSTCPTADALMSTNIKKIIEGGGYSGYAGYRPFNYVINSIKVTGPGDTGTNAYAGPFIGTKPAFYFGVIYAGYTFEQWGKSTQADGRSDFDVAQGFTSPEYKKPKKIEKIQKAGAEWFYADAWYAEVDAPGINGTGGFQRKAGGTWPYLQGTTSSLSPNGQMMIPSWSYHNTRRIYDLSISNPKADTNPNSRRFTEGRTNAIFADGHAAGVRRWKGTVNPCYPGDASCN